jgi:hypothetical protein
MRFDDPVFLFKFLPALFAVYYAVIAAEGLHPRLAGYGAKAATVVLLAGSVWGLTQGPVAWLLIGSAFVTILLGAIGEQTRTTNEARVSVRARPCDDRNRRCLRSRAWLLTGNVFETGGRVGPGVSEWPSSSTSMRAKRRPANPPPRGCISSSFQSCLRDR